MLSQPCPKLNEIPTAQRLILDLLGTAEQTSSAGSNKTGLLSLDGVSRNGGSLSDMLMVTLRCVSVQP